MLNSQLPAANWPLEGWKLAVGSWQRALEHDAFLQDHPAAVDAESV